MDIETVSDSVYWKNMLKDHNGFYDTYTFIKQQNNKFNLKKFIQYVFENEDLKTYKNEIDTIIVDFDELKIANDQEFLNCLNISKKTKDLIQLLLEIKKLEIEFSIYKEQINEKIILIGSRIQYNQKQFREFKNVVNEQAISTIINTLQIKGLL